MREGSAVWRVTVTGGSHAMSVGGTELGYQAGEFGSAGNAQRGARPVDVSLHGAHRYHQRFRDLLVGQAAGDEGGDLAFAAGQWQWRGSGPGGGSACAALADESTGPSAGRQGRATPAASVEGQRRVCGGVRRRYPVAHGLEIAGNAE